MIAQWEEFGLGPTEPLADRLHASINYKGTILINGNLHEMLGKPEAVKLLFDRVNSVIGVVGSPETLDKAFPLRKQSEGRHRLIRASPFCRHFGIRITGTNSFLEPTIDDNGILRLELNSSYHVAHRARPRRAE